MRLYDTATGNQQDLIIGQTVSLYVCGVTPYDAAHMGHIFTFLTYDVLQRYLEHRGHRVKLVRNITDVDEPIYQRAREQAIDYRTLAATETSNFQSIMQRLNFRPAFAEPKASEYIAEMAAAVDHLLHSRHAYRLENGDIYFDVATFPAFGRQNPLSDRLQLAFMADRGGDPERADKRQPLDFLLWKAIADPQDPARWESVVGTGRPGWHIECSVMSQQLLGTPIDIHGGGMDLIFPHHACEIAQSESLGQVPFVQRWLHVAPLYYHGEKMSKSLGNLVFARDLLQDYEPDVIRLSLLQYHYRIGGEWHADALQAAHQQLAIIRQALTISQGIDPAPYLERFYAALDNDLDLPEAVHALVQLARHSRQTGGTNSATVAALREMSAIFGLSLAA